jgi:transcriptional regulator with XRE-family HTH domain
MTLGEKLKALREERGWSQYELSERAGVRQALLSELELGKKEDTTGRNLRRLARALHVSVDYLIGRYNESPDPKPRSGVATSLVASPLLPAPSPL